ncbi:MAG: hypothetical protein A2268_01775 [Candidatus Raymondbacteria bacterium RifOxyA12_full_50_37]|uniref:Uncharacterized protein n=1 Tax=Candidatus Raymondbacteria bacterium RIFOXYD12_FULL_49_13 TaxID=1817890 RepID=A0A1F7F9Y2_UNCRA|nr:MAG: hypothetical protein A2268_01775 [Candidatus Raymondbacteria bacterium RifOxyA12_full_50_37]OGJ87794.1 MAG: hypothetical protein A2248_07380 [Candidatus Raymondbacteria bacterium RIFOXYA2_FULL_49_16]OGJ95672.1 MAG: hypothetical protein A2453_13375 [Candidatus Raymondbacteria bacterium RIFOXYC2_FULL_50_21]OGK03443.1 MAG: hypothetical protein A2519_15655 [Candidatus Raymondbacteria bacterium RIFOXYD12_FULL_49_13]OGK05078.1 MAG: hypothetical protein A2487_15940 [Candidatus Raymondbacteria 
MNLHFAISPIPKTFFGPGKIHVAPKLLEPFQTKVLVITGKRFAETPAWEIFKKFPSAPIFGEPSPKTIDNLVTNFRPYNIKAVVAIGGGSVIDTGKAVSAMLRVDGSVADYLETVGSRIHSGEKVPFFAIPTTAGTGSEATKNAVISVVGSAGFKKSLRHDAFMPNYAIIDPELTLSCPRSLTACCGMDALSQLLESYVSTKATLFSETCAFDGLCYFGKYFNRVLANGSDLEARTGLAYAAYLSGLSLCFGGLGAVHGLAGAIGGMCQVPHAQACATLMYQTNRATIQRLLEKEGPNGPAVAKFVKAAHALVGTGTMAPKEACEYLLEKIAQWSASAGLKKLATFGFSHTMAETIMRKPDYKNNPVPLSEDEINTIFQEQLQ